jgi:hypothetical protein
MQWRLPLGFQAFFALFLVLQILMLPETPRYTSRSPLVEYGCTNSLIDGLSLKIAVKKQPRFWQILRERNISPIIQE